jgi:hypothetical protein
VPLPSSGRRHALPTAERFSAMSIMRKELLKRSFPLSFVLDAGFWHGLDSTLALKRGPKRPRPPPFTLPRDAGNTPSLAASLSARVRRIPASCATNGAGTAPVFGRPLVQIALAALEPLVSSRSVQLAVHLHLARFI